MDFELYKQATSENTLLEIMFGSSEVGKIGSTIVDHQFSFPQEGVPVGYSPAGKTIILIDEHANPVAPGEVGEIAVKGVKRSPGYWAASDRTSAKFIADPDGTDERIYLTGDLGRMLPGGFLIHLGRKDLMVKIRGYRVNISDVEAALLDHVQVKEAGVASWDSDSEEKYLVGYVVLRKEAAVNVSDLNEFLRTRLPDYMIPSAFIFLESLPLTNGKLDRHALPRPGHQRPELAEAYLAPRSSLEKTLTEIWSNVLDIDRVGIRDNFLDLGGHSLAATRVASQVIEKLQLKLPLRTLFEAPTIEQMAVVIIKNRGTEAMEQKLECMMGELHALSDEEAQHLVAEETVPNSSGKRNE